jgi:hypothetical protein
MDKFGIMIMEYRTTQYLADTPYRSVEAMAQDIIDWQIDDPKEIVNMYWIENGKSEEITKRVAQLVWQHYDATEDHLHKETNYWLLSKGFDTDHMVNRNSDI